MEYNELAGDPEGPAVLARYAMAVYDSSVPTLTAA